MDSFYQIVVYLDQKVRASLAQLFLKSGSSSILPCAACQSQQASRRQDSQDSAPILSEGSGDAIDAFPPHPLFPSLQG